MTLPVLIAISIMWFPLALYLLGKGEVKSTGAICGLVGIVVVIGAILQAAIFKDGFTAGLLFVHGILYLSTSYALITGIEDLRSVGNVSLVTCIVSAIYMVLFFTGGPVLEGGNQLVARSNYFAFACAGYTVLTFEVWLFAYGKFSPKNLAGSLIAWVPFGLFIPAFWLMVTGTLPF
jgi:hypothetical protein